jgi:hypothetical protein
MGGENLSLYTPYRTLFCHRSPSREDTTRSVPHDLGDLALSAYPRPGLDPASTYHRSIGRKDRRGTGLEVFSPSRPLRHHGVRGWPAIPRACHYSHLYRNRQNFTSRLPRRPCLLLPYKRAGRGSTRGAKKKKNEQRTTNNETPVSIPPKKINISSNLLCTLTFPLRPELGSLSQLVTPMQALRCKEIQYSPSPLDVGPSFAQTRINPHVSSLHHHPD